MHTASKRIIDLLVKEEIGTLVIGKNDGWKQEVEMGKRTNQNFVYIPHARFISMLTYKAELIGITVLLTEESYTSKASLLDLDPLPKWKKDKSEKPVFSGKRVKRGLYRASNGRLVNADINGAGNSIRKVVPDAFGLEGIEDGKAIVTSLVVHPVRVVIPLTKPEGKRKVADEGCHSPHEARREAESSRKQAVKRTLYFAIKRYTFWNYWVRNC
jgi:putative transposase